MSKHFFFFLLSLQALFCFGQVPVSKEPRHHNVFENEFVRVLDVHMLPGDTSLFHKHETPSVFIMIHNVRTGSEVIIQEGPATALSKDPSISFEGFYVTPRIHRVWNRDTSEFHVMDVEILNRNNKKNSILTNPAFQVLFDEKPVTAYRLTLIAQATTSIKRENPLLIVGLSNATNSVIVNKKAFIKKSDFVFIPAGEAVSFSSKDQQPYSFAVLELK